MNFWDNFKKHLTSLIDMPIEVAQASTIQRHALLTNSGVVSYSQLKLTQTSTKGRVLRESPSKLPREPGLSYSRELEKIYALETVDPRTVRVLNSAKTDSQKIATSFEANEPSQNEFDFGPAWRNWITPCQLFEPIQALNLSPQAEKVFITHGWSTIADLLNINTTSLVHVKGLGQGHIDELTHKLSAHFRSRSTTKRYSIDWCAWLRSLVADLTPKESKILLEHFGLSEALHIPAHLTGEIRSLKSEEKLTLVKQILEKLRASDLPKKIKIRWQEITLALITPWMAQRYGIAHRDELMERLESISEQPLLTKSALFLLQNILGEKHPSLFSCVYSGVAHEIFAMNAEKAGFYSTVTEIAHSYFYKATLSYSVTELVLWIQKELIRRWEQCNASDVERVIYYTPAFCIRRSPSGIRKVLLRQTTRN